MAPVSDVRVATRSRENTRARLLEAAYEVFAEVGLDAASVEDICERAGFTRGAFYSNFESKDQLFLELAGRVARGRVAEVQARVESLQAAGAFESVRTDPLALIDRVLDVSAEDRRGVLLMSEIRIHALRNPDLAVAYLAQEGEMRASVEQIITDIARINDIAFRLPADEAAALFLTVWEGTSVRSAMAGLDDAEICRRTGEQMALLAQLLIEPR